MQTINITVHPTESTQIEALKAVMKALKIKFEIAKDKSYIAEKEVIIDNLKKGFEEIQLIKKGKLKTTSLNDFLNEL
jgi:hypothetical protein